MRQGRRLAIDVGKVRIGLAISDLSGSLALPLETVSRLTQEATVAALAQIVSENDCFEIYVGLPIGLSGSPTPSTYDALAIADGLAKVVTAPVRFIDERLTSVSAASNLRAAGRNSKSFRAVIDQEAARLILDMALETERNSAKAPGWSRAELAF